jgi:hypothetical protein
VAQPALVRAALIGLTETTNCCRSASNSTFINDRLLLDAQ